MTFFFCLHHLSKQQFEERKVSQRDAMKNLRCNVIELSRRKYCCVSRNQTDFNHKHNFGLIKRGGSIQQGCAHYMHLHKFRTKPAEHVIAVI